MNRNQLLLTIGLSTIAGGCSAIQPRAELNIRAVDTQQLAAGESQPLAEGRKQLALGQSGLAISSFRAALRETPDNPEALNGLGIAYDRIGRADLAQRYFELAVAAAPLDNKFSGNLARFFERTGKPQMAQGLAQMEVGESKPVDASILNATEPKELPPLIALAASEAETLVTPGLDLSVPQIADVAALEPPLPEVQAATSPASKSLPQLAVYRPAAPVAIRAASIDTNIIPAKPAGPAPEKGQERMPFDAPRSPASSMPREAVRLERVSLGEVRLITRPQTAPQAKMPQRQLSSDFHGFGARLATWLPAAIVAERQADAEPVKAPVLRQALAKVKLEIAVNEADENLARAKEQPKFTYAFFEGDRLLETSLASL